MNCLPRQQTPNSQVFWIVMNWNVDRKYFLNQSSEPDVQMLIHLMSVANAGNNEKSFHDVLVVNSSDTVPNIAR